MIYPPDPEPQTESEQEASDSECYEGDYGSNNNGCEGDPEPTGEGDPE